MTGTLFSLSPMNSFQSLQISHVFSEHFNDNALSSSSAQTRHYEL